MKTFKYPISLLNIPVLILALVMVTLLAIASESRAAKKMNIKLDPFEQCFLDGGREVPQPPGGDMRICCTKNYCIVCDENWDNCEETDTYVKPHKSLDDKQPQKLKEGDKGFEDPVFREKAIKKKYKKK